MVILEENFKWHLEAFASDQIFCHENCFRCWHGIK